MDRLEDTTFSSSSRLVMLSRILRGNEVSVCMHSRSHSVWTFTRVAKTAQSQLQRCMHFCSFMLQLCADFRSILFDALLVHPALHWEITNLQPIKTDLNRSAAVSILRCNQRESDFAIRRFKSVRIVRYLKVKIRIWSFQHTPVLFAISAVEIRRGSERS